MTARRVTNKNTTFISDANADIDVEVRTTATPTDIQQVQIDIGTGTGTSPVTAANPLPVTLISPATSSISSVTSSASVVTLLALLSTRMMATFFNNTDKSCYIKLGSAASTTSFTCKMAAGSYYEIPGSKVYTGIITGIWDATPSGEMLITSVSP